MHPERSRTFRPRSAWAGAEAPCDGIYWFRLFQRRYWNTTRLPNGRYLLVVRAWDSAGNRARKDVEVRIDNPPV